MTNTISFQKKSALLGIAALACLLFTAVPQHQAMAQETQTLLSGDVSHGGFGGPVIRFGSVDGSGAVWVGGRGGWIINFSNQHSISLGGGGYGLVTEHQLPQPFDSGRNELAAIGYGGFEMEYTNQTYRLVHLTASTLIGAGGITVRDHNLEHLEDDANAFFVFEPGLNAELNVTSFFRLAAGVSYRFISGLDYGGFQDSDFSGVNAVLTFKFGAF